MQILLKFTKLLWRIFILITTWSFQIGMLIAGYRKRYAHERRSYHVGPAKDWTRLE